MCVRDDQWFKVKLSIEGCIVDSDDETVVGAFLGDMF
jgi:hypothetical protein